MAKVLYMIQYSKSYLFLLRFIVVKVLSEKIFVIDRKQNVKQISYDGRECACLTISILSFQKRHTRNVKLPFHAKYKVVATFHKSDSSL